MVMARRLDGSFSVLGSRIPTAVGILIGLTLGSTILAAVGSRNGWPILEYGVLRPDLVWHGQVWRLLTWAFFEFSLAPLGLVFACACLFSFGRELCYRWGAAWLLWSYAAVTVLTGLVTCLVGFLWPSVMINAYFTAWATIDAMIIAWAIAVPHAQMVFNFVLPLRGRQIIYVTIGITVLAGLFAGLHQVVPHLVAIAATMFYMRDPALYSFWLRMKLRALQHAPRKRSAHLRPVDRDDVSKPPRWLH